MSFADQLKQLNKKFTSRSLLSNEFYIQLNKMGFICEKSVLVSLFPDGSNTYCGKLINQHGILYEFDIDLDDFKYSWCIEISFDNGKTSRIEAAAFEMFAGLRKESDRGE